jgi:hypothetical protein
MKDLISGYEMVVGVFLPLLISVFIKESWDRPKKIGMSFLFVLLASIGSIFYSGELDLGKFGETVLKILILTVTTYKGFWSATGVTDIIEKKVGLTGKPGTGGLKALLPFLILPTLIFGSMTLQGCATAPSTSGSIAEPWYIAYQSWTKEQKADFFMEMWMQQEADYKTMNAYPNKSEALIKALKVKREVLEQSRVPLRTYATIVKGGGTPDAAMEQQIVAWLTQLQLNFLTGGK